MATTKTTYDTYGRVTSVISPNEVAAATNGSVTMTYTPATGYPHSGVTTTPLAGAVTKHVPYPAWGTTRRVEDVSNGDVTSIAVDHLGRTTSVTRPGDGATPSSTFEYRVTAGVPNYVRTNQLLSGTSYVSSWEYLDGLGRTLQTQEPDPTGGTGRRLTMTRYDSLGQVAAVSQPFGGDGSPGSGLAVVASTDIPFETRHGYDSAGRVYRTAQWASNVLKHATNTDYHGWHHAVDAPVHSDVDYHTNALGQLTSVVERPSSGTITTTYTHTRHGDLATVTDTAGNLTSYTYDDLRRRTASSDPDLGAWSTTYTAEGDVREVTDAKSEKVAYTYDRARRRTEARAGVGGSLLAQWTYDTLTNGVGQLTSATSYSGGAAYTTAVTGYDNRGRATGRSWTIPATPAAALAATYTFGYGYNERDDLVSVAMPAAGDLPAETVTTGLNAAGLPVSLTGTDTYVGSTVYRSDGRLQSRNLVGGVTRTYAYENNAGRLGNVTATAPLAGQSGSPDIENTTYTYDHDGNVTSVADKIAGVGTTPQRECFHYDPLNRLTAGYTTGDPSCPATPPTSVVSFGIDPYLVTYAYDNVGNITSAKNGTVTSAYTYGYPGHAHAVNTIAGAQFQYDPNGATTTRPTPGGAQTLTWDRFHRLTSVGGPGGSSFIYDADGARLLRSTGTTTTLYLDGMELTATGSTVTAKRFYGGHAMRTSAGVQVLLRNGQNSTTAAYDPVGDTVAYQRYTPYGSRRGATPLAATERRFLDKTEDLTGLTAMGARYYDAASARFISIDPLANLAQPQSLAGYSYALNNPATLSDPSGLEPHPVPGYGWAGNGCSESGSCEANGPSTPKPTPQVAPTPPTQAPPDPNPGATTYTYTPASTVCTTPSPGVPASCGTSAARIDGPGPGVTDILYGVFVGPVKSTWKNGNGCFDGGIWACVKLWVNLMEVATIVAPVAKAGAAATRAIRTRRAAKLTAGGRGAASAIESTLNDLPTGYSAGVRVTDELHMAVLFHQWSRGGAAMANSYPGRMVRLADGTRIGLRSTSTSGGPTLDIFFPNGTSAKIHVKS